MDLINKYTNQNHLIKLLELFPDREWYWEDIMENPNITFDFIKNNLDKLYRSDVFTKINLAWGKKINKVTRYINDLNTINKKYVIYLTCITLCTRSLRTTF